jgi:hypothetical protein
VSNLSFDCDMADGNGAAIPAGAARRWTRHIMPLGTVGQYPLEQIYQRNFLEWRYVHTGSVVSAVEVSNATLAPPGVILPGPPIVDDEPVVHRWATDDANDTKRNGSNSPESDPFQWEQPARIGVPQPMDERKDEVVQPDGRNDYLDTDKRPMYWKEGTREWLYWPSRELVPFSKVPQSASDKRNAIWAADDRRHGIDAQPVDEKKDEEAPRSVVPIVVVAKEPPLPWTDEYESQHRYNWSQPGMPGTYYDKDRNEMKWNPELGRWVYSSPYANASQHWFAGKLVDHDKVPRSAVWKYRTEQAQRLPLTDRMAAAIARGEAREPVVIGSPHNYDEFTEKIRVHLTDPRVFMYRDGTIVHLNSGTVDRIDDTLYLDWVPPPKTKKGEPIKLTTTGYRYYDGRAVPDEDILIDRSIIVRSAGEHDAKRIDSKGDPPPTESYYDSSGREMIRDRSSATGLPYWEYKHGTNRAEVPPLDRQSAEAKYQQWVTLRNSYPGARYFLDRKLLVRNTGGDGLGAPVWVIKSSGKYVDPATAVVYERKYQFDQTLIAQPVYYDAHGQHIFHSNDMYDWKWYRYNMFDDNPVPVVVPLKTVPFSTIEAYRNDPLPTTFTFPDIVVDKEGVPIIHDKHGRRIIVDEEDEMIWYYMDNDNAMVPQHNVVHTDLDYWKRKALYLKKIMYKNGYIDPQIERYNVFVPKVYTDAEKKNQPYQQSIQKQIDDWPPNELRNWTVGPLGPASIWVDEHICTLERGTWQVNRNAVIGLLATRVTGGWGAGFGAVQLSNDNRWVFILDGSADLDLLVLSLESEDEADHWTNAQRHWFDMIARDMEYAHMLVGLYNIYVGDRKDELYTLLPATVALAGAMRVARDAITVIDPVNYHVSYNAIRQFRQNFTALVNNRDAAMRPHTAIESLIGGDRMPAMLETAVNLPGFPNKHKQQRPMYFWTVWKNIYKTVKATVKGPNSFVLSTEEKKEHKEAMLLYRTELLPRLYADVLQRLEDDPEISVLSDHLLNRCIAAMKTTIVDPSEAMAQLTEIGSSIGALSANAFSTVPKWRSWKRLLTWRRGTLANLGDRQVTEGVKTLLEPDTYPLSARIPEFYDIWTRICNPAKPDSAKSRKVYRVFKQERNQARIDKLRSDAKNTVAKYKNQLFSRFTGLESLLEQCLDQSLAVVWGLTVPFRESDQYSGSEESALDTYKRLTTFAEQAVASAEARIDKDGPAKIGISVPIKFKTTLRSLVMVVRDMELCRMYKMNNDASMEHIDASGGEADDEQYDRIVVNVAHGMFISEDFTKCYTDFVRTIVSNPALRKNKLVSWILMSTVRRIDQLRFYVFPKTLGSGEQQRFLERIVSLTNYVCGVTYEYGFNSDRDQDVDRATQHGSSLLHNAILHTMLELRTAEYTGSSGDGYLDVELFTIRLAALCSIMAMWKNLPRKILVVTDELKELHTAGKELRLCYKQFADGILTGDSLKMYLYCLVSSSGTVANELEEPVDHEDSGNVVTRFERHFESDQKGSWKRVRDASHRYKAAEREVRERHGEYNDGPPPNKEFAELEAIHANILDYVRSGEYDMNVLENMCKRSQALWALQYRRSDESLEDIKTLIKYATAHKDFIIPPRERAKYGEIVVQNLYAVVNSGPASTLNPGRALIATEHKKETKRATSIREGARVLDATVQADLYEEKRKIGKAAARLLQLGRDNEQHAKRIESERSIRASESKIADVRHLREIMEWIKGLKQPPITNGEPHDPALYYTPKGVKSVIDLEDDSHEGKYDNNVEIDPTPQMSIKVWATRVQLARHRYNIACWFYMYIEPHESEFVYLKHSLLESKNAVPVIQYLLDAVNGAQAGYDYAVLHVPITSAPGTAPLAVLGLDDDDDDDSNILASSSTKRFWGRIKIEHEVETEESKKLELKDNIDLITETVLRDAYVELPPTSAFSDAVTIEHRTKRQSAEEVTALKEMKAAEKIEGVLLDKLVTANEYTANGALLPGMQGPFFSTSEVNALYTDWSRAKKQVQRTQEVVTVQRKRSNLVLIETQIDATRKKARGAPVTRREQLRLDELERSKRKHEFDTKEAIAFHTWMAAISIPFNGTDEPVRLYDVNGTQTDEKRYRKYIGTFENEYADILSRVVSQDDTYEPAYYTVLKQRIVELETRVAETEANWITLRNSEAIQFFNPPLKPGMPAYVPPAGFDSAHPERSDPWADPDWDTELYRGALEAKRALQEDEFSAGKGATIRDLVDFSREQIAYMTLRDRFAKRFQVDKKTPNPEWLGTDTYAEALDALANSGIDPNDNPRGSVIVPDTLERKALREQEYAALLVRLDEKFRDEPYHKIYKDRARWYTEGGSVPPVGRTSGFLPDMRGLGGWEAIRKRAAFPDPYPVYDRLVEANTFEPRLAKPGERILLPGEYKEDGTFVPFHNKNGGYNAIVGRMPPPIDPETNLVIDDDDGVPMLGKAIIRHVHVPVLRHVIAKGGEGIIIDIDAEVAYVPKDDEILVTIVEHKGEFDKEGNSREFTYQQLFVVVPDKVYLRDPSDDDTKGNKDFDAPELLPLRWDPVHQVMETIRLVKKGHYIKGFRGNGDDSRPLIPYTEAIRLAHHDTARDTAAMEQQSKKMYKEADGTVLVIGAKLSYMKAQQRLIDYKRLIGPLRLPIGHPPVELDPTPAPVAAPPPMWLYSPSAAVAGRAHATNNRLIDNKNKRSTLGRERIGYVASRCR